MSTVVNMYWEGNFGPVSEEITALDLPVHGVIPPELEGRLLRNGPNPIGEVDRRYAHWFGGHGMVHGVRIRGGRAEWYRNRWVRSEAVSDALGEQRIPGNRGSIDFAANTNVGAFGGRTYAMVEAGSRSIELGYELDSLRWVDFEGTLPHGLTAHPKVDPATGDLHAMCYSWTELFDHIEYVVVGRDGVVKSVTDIALPGMSMVHDMSITERYAVVYDLSVTVDLDLALGGKVGFPFRWNPDYGARVGLVPLGGGPDAPIWCDLEPCYAYHPLNAYDDAEGNVVIDLITYTKMFADDVWGPVNDSPGVLERWTINPTRRTVRRDVVDERGQEFPRVRANLTGRFHRYGYCAAVDATFNPGATLKHDFVTGVTTAHDHGPGRGTAEPAFVRRPDGTDEDDGWLISYVYDAARNMSDVVILDARDMSVPPLARIELPTRVPHGFHGNWVPDSAVSAL